MWLIQAGAVINEQDYVGETAVHKAARAGSMDCLKTLAAHGALIDFRNASDLTAADLAHSQGFRECAQFLLNLQNSQLNGLYCNGSLNAVHHNTPPSHLNGGANRKRSFQCMEASAVKKLRVEGKSFGGAVEAEFVSGEDDDDMMHVEISDVKSSSLYNSLMNGGVTKGCMTQLGEMEASSPKFLIPKAPNTPVTNVTKECGGGHENLSENNDEVVNSSMCGSLHVNGSPSSWVSHRPSWAEGYGESLQYGHYHGFGDTAESLPELSSVVDHSNSVSVECKYNQTFISTLQQYMGF
ncbi:hypothetical protein FKM82_009033 [Ascaphus truei]